MRNERAPRNVETYMSNGETRDTFKNRLQRLPKENRRMILLAYDFAKVAHSGQMRDNKEERFFEHPRMTALNLLDKAKTKNPVIIASALLHDVVEDTSIFGDPRDHYYQEWVTETRENMSKLFGEEVTNVVITLTKPPKQLKDFEGLTPEEIQVERRVMHFANLKTGPSEAILVKFADRLHNIDSLFGSEEKKRQKLIETTALIMPLAEYAVKEYPQEMARLKRNLEKSIARATSIISK